MPELAPGGTTPSAGTPGVSQVIATAQETARNVLLDDEYAYWGVDLGTSGAVRRVKKEGGGVETLATVGTKPFDLAMDDDNIYWGDEAGTIHQVSKHGGCPVVLATGQDEPTVTTSDGAFVFWANLFDGAIRGAPVGGGPVVEVAKNQNGPFSIRVDATHVYWSNIAGNVEFEASVAKAPKDGSGPTVYLVEGTTVAWDVELDGDDVYWLAANAHEIRRVPKAGGPDALVASVVGGADIAIGADAFYSVSTAMPPRVLRVPRADPTMVSELTKIKGYSFYGATDATHVYWTMPKIGEIARILK